MLSTAALKHNFVVERNLLLRHCGPNYAPSYPLLREDRDEMRRLKNMKHNQQRGDRPKAKWADQPQKMMLVKKRNEEEVKEEREEEVKVRPVLVDELCHLCATCESVTEHDFKSSDGSKYFCSFKCRQKGERPQMTRGERLQEETRAAHMKK